MIVVYYGVSAAALQREITTIIWILAVLVLILTIAQARSVVVLRRLRDRLEAEEQTLPPTFRASPDAVTITSLPEGRLLDCNDGFTRLSGYRREDVLGRTTRELQIWGRERDRDRLMELLRTEGRVGELEVEVRVATQEMITCLVSSAIVELAGKPCLFSIIRDISEHKRAQEILRISEEKFSKAFRASPDAIVITSMADGKIADVNEGFSRISAWSREEVLGRTAFDIDLWENPAERELLLEELRRVGRVRERFCELQMKSGEVRNFLLWVEVIIIGDEPHMLTVAHDVTERLRTAAERERVLRELEAKNAELERFTYTVSHDLKSPLVTIRGFLGLLERDAELGDREKMRNDIDRIKAATETMRRLLDELLELSRLGHQDFQAGRVDLSELAKEAVDQVAGRLLDSGLLIEIATELPTVTGDRTRLLEVLQNLLDNAIKFMGDQPEPRIELGVRQDGGERTFFVRDNGLGVAAQYREKIFGLFERLDQSIDGTGVGLALVKRIIELHGGRIWVESEGKGRGSTFCFTLEEATSAASVDPPGM